MLFLHKKIAHIDGHISAQSDSHILKLKTSKLLLAISNMNIMNFGKNPNIILFSVAQNP
jgi:hypothetical protein